MFEQAFLSISKKMQLSEVFYKRDTLKNFAKFTGKLARTQVWNFLKNETQQRYFPEKFAKS